MAEPFLAEIKMVGYNFAQRGWAQCDGQILPINQYQSLYVLLGTTYGGDRRTTFALPDLNLESLVRAALTIGSGQSTTRAPLCAIAGSTAGDRKEGAHADHQQPELPLGRSWCRPGPTPIRRTRKEKRHASSSTASFLDMERAEPSNEGQGPDPWQPKALRSLTS